MNKTENMNNEASVTGVITTPFTFSHEVYGEKFYMAEIAVDRLSGQTDILPMTIPERLINTETDYLDCMVKLSGQFRSYNHHDGERSHLILSFFVRRIEVIEECTDNSKANQIFLEGYLRKEPTYRKTPLGREITDILLAVQRPNGKSDLIPCIAWGKNARYASGFEVGTRARIWGRIQSREYTKKLSETEFEKRIAYEVSINELELINGDTSMEEVESCSNEKE